jgi:cobalt/nickel transport system permease protein
MLNRVLFIIALLLLPKSAWAMHISEGILPLGWSVFWFVVIIPFVAYGLRRFRKVAAENLEIKPLVGLLAAVVFIFSAMPVPVPVAGSTSHPCGVGISAVLLGPGLSILIALAALLMQALFMAHGGLSTLGANVFSMGVLGSISAFAVFYILRRMKAGLFISGFLCGLIADWATYTGTAISLSLGIKGEEEFITIFTKVIIAFLPTQIPIGILEGFVTAGMITLLVNKRLDILYKLKVIDEGTLG